MLCVPVEVVLRVWAEDIRRVSWKVGGNIAPGCDVVSEGGVVGDPLGLGN